MMLRLLPPFMRTLVSLTLLMTGSTTSGYFPGLGTRSMDGDEVASGTDCTFISGTRLMPSKSFASVLASSVRLGLACCGETTLVFVLGARPTPDVSPVGAQASSTRSTANEVSPPAWPRLPRLLLLRRGRWWDRPGCCSSATGEDVVDSAATERAGGRHCRRRAAEEGVPCRSYRRGT
jgi:hypothetical protein